MSEQFYKLKDPESTYALQDHLIPCDIGWRWCDQELPKPYETVPIIDEHGDLEYAKHDPQMDNWEDPEGYTYKAVQWCKLMPPLTAVEEKTPQIYQEEEMTIKEVQARFNTDYPFTPDHDKYEYFKGDDPEYLWNQGDEFCTPEIGWSIKDIPDSRNPYAFYRRKKEQKPDYDYKCWEEWFNNKSVDQEALYQNIIQRMKAEGLIWVVKQLYAKTANAEVIHPAN